MRNFGKKVRLGLIGLSAATLMVGATAVPATAVPATPHTLAAADCAGKLVDSWAIKAGSQKIGEVALYWNAATGMNCARTNHLGVTYGKSLRTSVWLAACKEKSGSRCTFLPGSPKAEDGKFSYHAGPVSVKGAGHCVHVAGDIYYGGIKRHVDSSPWLSHC